MLLINEVMFAMWLYCNDVRFGMIDELRMEEITRRLRIDQQQDSLSLAFYYAFDRSFSILDLPANLISMGRVTGIAPRSRTHEPIIHLRSLYPHRGARIHSLAFPHHFTPTANHQVNPEVPRSVKPGKSALGPPHRKASCVRPHVVCRSNKAMSENFLSLCIHQRWPVWDVRMD